MSETIPYLLPSAGHLRAIGAVLKDGRLPADQANVLIDQGIPMDLVARYVQDLDWWKSNAVLSTSELSLPWEIQSWQATLSLQTEGLSVWVDPGPYSPMPSTSPDLILLTHAHRDHYERLGDLSSRWPAARVIMTEQTNYLLEESDPDLARLIQPHLIRLEYNSPRKVMDCEIRAYPAGHVLGAAMFALHHDTDNILISGEFTLREVGGLPGASIPPGQFGLVVMPADTPDCDHFPFADEASTHQRLLKQIHENVCAGKTSILVKVQALGQAQEVYAAITNAQRAGAFASLKVFLHGRAAQVSEMYRKTLGGRRGPWSLPILQPGSLIEPNSIVITSSDRQALYEPKNLPETFAEITTPNVFTHGSWSEHLAFAGLTCCQKVALYNETSHSLAAALKKNGAGIAHSKKGSCQ